MDSVKGKNNEVFRRKRKMMLVLPVILIPLLTIGFYALGGGKGGSDGRGIVLTKGLNMSLPEAKFDKKKKSLNKLGFYNQSEQDSIKLRERRKMDPYYGRKDTGMLVGVAVNGEQLNRPMSPGLKLESAPTDVQAGDLMHKLELLKGVLIRQQQEAIPDLPLAGRNAERTISPRAAPGGVVAAPVDAAPGRVGQGDPDLDKLNTLMDKVLRVRYPGDAPLHDSAPGGHADRSVETLSAPKPEEVMTTLLDEKNQDLETGFIDLDEDRRGDSLAENMIAAVVDGAQTLISGEAVAFRTLGDAMLGGLRVPSGTSLSGKAVLAGERLSITVNAIRTGSRVTPVSLEVVDMDGMAGIRVKGSINRDVSKVSAEEAVGSLGVTTVDPGLAGQATAAGLQAAKTLLNRKIRLVKLGLPAGYRVLLRNTKSNH